MEVRRESARTKRTVVTMERDWTVSQESRKARKARQSKAPSPIPIWRFALFFVAGFLGAVVVVWAQQSWGERDEAPPPEETRRVRGRHVARLNTVFRRIEACLSTERYGDAFLELKEAERVAPADPRVHHGFGEVYRNLDRAELAEKAYRKALLLDPDYQIVKIRLAQILCKLGKNEEAVGLLREVQKKQPKNPALWAALARNAMRLGKPGEAITWLEKYNAALGRQVWGCANLGRAYAEAGNHEAAEKAFREAIAIDPKTRLAYLWLGQLLVATGRKTEAEHFLETFRLHWRLSDEIRTLERALLRRPDNFRALVGLARARYAMGKVREALIPLKRAVELAPDDQQLRGLYEKLSREAQMANEHEKPVQSSR